MKKAITLIISTLISLLMLELVCRSFLNLGNHYSETSLWQKEKWIENHRNNGSRLAYTIDRYDSVLGWTLKENLSDHKMVNDGIYRWTVSSNSNGYRGKDEFSYTKNKKTRILFIGDSYTFGECVGDSETIPYLTQKFLPDAEVINMAVHGYGNDQQYLKLSTEGMKYSPDIVILGYNYIDQIRNHLYFRDYAKPYFILQNDTLQLKGVPVPLPETYLQAPDIRSWSLIKANYAKYFQTVSYNPADQLTLSILESMYKTCSNSKTEFIILYLPMPDECKKGIELFPSLKDSICARHSLKCISPVSDVHQFLSTEKDIEKHFKCHYSSAINYIIAQNIAISLSCRIKNTATE